MSITLSKGVKKPETGDRDFWNDLEDNAQLQNDHNHDGVNSEKISPGDLDKTVQDIAQVSWVAVSGEPGTYKQTITVPAGHTLANVQMKFFVNGGGEDGFEVHPTIRKASSTTFDIFINDNSVALKAVYG
ncbi:MAG: hypothetical protein KF767_08835 [Bdellovibrionaceae bacterium]|nr:hypothetical protein [Pseudobdellovibrionaceae bacterium]